jgi:hypothetical protein
VTTRLTPRSDRWGGHPCVGGASGQRRSCSGIYRRDGAGGCTTAASQPRFTCQAGSACSSDWRNPSSSHQGGPRGCLTADNP